MQKLIVTSSTYRQSSRVTPELLRRDPYNRLFARGPRFRLDAEMLRDDLEAKGPVKLSDVESAQKEILMTTRKMADEGRLQLGGKGGEEYV